MSDKKCCVPGCVHLENSHKILHRFPNPDKDLERFNVWMNSIGGELMKLTTEFIFKNRRVCNDHFKHNYLCRNHRISNIAIPTLGMPDPAQVENNILISECADVMSTPTEIDNVNVSSTETYTQWSNSHLLSANLVASSGPAEGNTPNDLNESLTPIETNYENYNDYVLCDISTMSQYQNLTESLPSTSQDHPVNNPTKRGKFVKRCFTVMTKNEERLYSELRVLRRRLSKYKCIVKKQAASMKMAKKQASHSNDYLNCLENMPWAAKILTMMQCREQRKKNKGRRFNVDEKKLALTIFKESPEAYRFLRNILILPAPQTLISLINRAKLSNENVCKS